MVGVYSFSRKNEYIILKDYHLKNMSQNQKTVETYKNIMEKLINEIKDDFINEGCSEETLKDLKAVSIL